MPELVSKFIPPVSLPGLVVIWWLCMGVVGFFGNGLLTGGLVAVLAVGLAVLFYWASEPLESLFAHWYGWRESGESRLGRVAREYLPSDQKFDDARESAIHSLTGDSDVHHDDAEIRERAMALLRRHSRFYWSLALALSLADRLCRGLVTLSLFTAIAAAITLAFKPQIGADLPSVALAAAMIVALASAPLCFIGFVYCRWHHSMRLYRTVADL